LPVSWSSHSNGTTCYNMIAITFSFLSSKLRHRDFRSNFSCIKCCQKFLICCRFNVTSCGFQWAYVTVSRSLPQIQALIQDFIKMSVFQYGC
jgi:hypothetical protein